MPIIKSFNDDMGVTIEDDNFLEFENQTDGLSKKDKVLMFDFHNLIYRCVYAVIFQSPEDNEEFLLTKHNILSSIFESIEFHNPSWSRAISLHRGRSKYLAHQVQHLTQTSPSNGSNA